MINGVTQLIMMKSDVMNDFDTVKVAVAYEIGGERTTRFPFETEADIKPVYREFPGWKSDGCNVLYSWRCLYIGILG